MRMAFVVKSVNVFVVDFFKLKELESVPQFFNL